MKATLTGRERRSVGELAVTRACAERLDLRSRGEVDLDDVQQKSPRMVSELASLAVLKAL
jgi:hypothetical protein